MAVGLIRIEKVDAAFIYFGYEGGADTSFLKLRYDIICPVVTQAIVYDCGSGCAVRRSRHTDCKSVGFGDSGDLVEIDELGGICQFRCAEFEEEENRTSDALLLRRYKGKIVIEGKSLLSHAFAGFRGIVYSLSGQSTADCIAG